MEGGIGSGLFRDKIMGIKLYRKTAAVIENVKLMEGVSEFRKFYVFRLRKHMKKEDVERFYVIF